MATIDIRCPECSTIQRIDEDQLGATLQCPRCHMPFTAEAGDEYGLAGDPPPAAPEPPEHDPQPGTRTRPASPSSTRPAQPADESATQRTLRERMEKWAEE